MMIKAELKEQWFLIHLFHLLIYDFILINLLCVDTETEAIEIGPETNV